MIYVLEDNAEIRELEVYTLKNAGYEVRSFADGASMLAAVEETVPELVILDVMLPDMNGLEVLEKLHGRAGAMAVPVIMITAKTTEADKIKGFDSGADDYISKPFSLIEFLARTRAVLKRSSAPEMPEALRLADIEINRGERTVRANGAVCELTYKEFELLYLFIQHPDRVFSRDMLMDRVWGSDFLGESRTVDMHIKTLRQKLGESGKLIKTVRHVGYKISAN